MPFICIHIVEWHHADRVMRQFGYRQQILHAPMNIEHLHCLYLRSRNTVWADRHATRIEMWGRTIDWIQRGSPATGPVRYHTQYLDWYRTITYQWVGNSKIGGRS